MNIYVLKRNKVTDIRITVRANSMREVLVKLNQGWFNPTFKRGAKDVEILPSYNQNETPDYDIRDMQGDRPPNKFEKYRDRILSQIQGARYGYSFMDELLIQNAIGKLRVPY